MKKYVRRTLAANGKTPARGGPGKGVRGAAAHAVKAAFPLTVPVLTGYLFMGMAFGILLVNSGFAAPWATVMAVFIYAGSGQFVAVGLMAAGFNPAAAAVTTLAVNARHVFYGIPLLQRFKNFGKAKWYMVFALTDETFALMCSAKAPADVPEKHFYLAIAVMDHLYWIAGCTAGALLGSALPLNTAGIDFVMTALFVVILLEQWKIKANRSPALAGLAVTALCRAVFGPQWFVLAAMGALAVLFGLARRHVWQNGARQEENADAPQACGEGDAV